MSTHTSGNRRKIAQYNFNARTFVPTYIIIVQKNR